MGIVYLLYNETACYVGSTKQPLKERIQGHKDNYKQYLKNNRGFNSAYKILGSNFNYITIEEVINETTQEMTNRENWWINFYKPFAVNIYSAGCEDLDKRRKRKAEWQRNYIKRKNKN